MRRSSRTSCPQDCSSAPRQAELFFLKGALYTETSTQWLGRDRRRNKAFDGKTGRIGVHGQRSYYLLYQPNNRLDAGLDMAFLENVAKTDENLALVVYCEKLWVHRDQLRAWEREHGKRVRPMIVPFSLK